MKFILSLACCFLCTALSASAQLLGTLTEVQKSHIEANVPPEESFGSILNRNLIEYFQPSFKNVKLKIAYQLLRAAPTQSGVAYPKYYAWVTVNSEAGAVLEQGAVRLAAIEKVRFEVMNFISSKEIQVAPEKLNPVFPSLLIPNIKELSGKK